MSAYTELLGAVAPVFIMLIIGWVMRRTGGLTTEADSSILRLGVNVFYPALIADTILGNEALRHFGNVLLPAAAGAGTTLLGFGVAMIGARLLRLPQPHPAGTFAFSTGLQNYGFIAIPLIGVLFGRGALGVQFTFALGVELALWSAGIWLLRGGAKGRAGFAGSQPEEDTRPNVAVWREMLTPPVLAIIISTAINYFVGDTWLPKFGRSAMSAVGACSIPSQVILTGAILADVMRRVAAGHTLRPILLGNLLRLGVIPVLLITIGALIPASPELRHVIVVQAAMPSAMVPVVLVKYYDGDTDLAAWIVSTTTALSLFTIPLWLRAGLWWMGG